MKKITFLILTVLGLSVIMFSCKKKDKTTTPTIDCATSSLAVSATASSASITATATGGNSPYTYSIDGTTFQSSSTFSGLNAGNYTVTAKDANSCTKATAVSVTSGTITDSRDNQVYKTLQIGGLVWFAQNLNYDAGSHSQCYNGLADSCAKYGKLYDKSLILTSLCPNGWRISTDADWQALEISQGMSTSDANYFGYNNRPGVYNKLGAGTNFNILYSGEVINTTSGGAGSYTGFWTSTLYSSGKYFEREIAKTVPNNISRDTLSQSQSKLCIRCVQN